MFNNLTKEIFIYSLIPAFVIAIICVVLIIVSKKEKEKIYNYNYVIKVMIILIIGLVLPLITGYSIWVYERMVTKNIVSSNILYLLLLVFLIVSLIALLVVACTKLLKSFKEKDELNKERYIEKREFN